MIETAVDALNGGKIVVLPTDTVYGLCVSPYREEPAQKVFELKGRTNQQAIALIACWAPARRASRLDATLALRAE